MGIPTDVDYTVQEVRQKEYAALKMYHAFFQPNAERIYDIFLPAILEEVQARGIPIILHLPQPLVKCMNQLWQLVRDFPRLRIVLAHMGLTYFASNAYRDAIRELRDYPQLLMDTSIISNSNVIEEVLRVWGSERVLYGSDEPLSLMRVRFYEHPQYGPRATSHEKYHWLAEEERDISSTIPHLHWQILDGVVSAAASVYSKQKREDALYHVFHQNSQEVFGFSK